jgi:hypothetical protein
MVWSNWQGAIWRGALLVVLLWAGLAWTQPGPRPTGDGAERFLYVHESGRKTRCRVLESWLLPDGRLAHLLESVDSKEKITIVDEHGPSGEPSIKGQWGKQKRIYAWGAGQQTPPEGSPIPPHLRHDSGTILSAPVGVGGGPMILQRNIETKPQAIVKPQAPLATQPEIRLVQGTTTSKNAVPQPTVAPRSESGINVVQGQGDTGATKTPTEAGHKTPELQIIEFEEPNGGKTGASPAATGPTIQQSVAPMPLPTSPAPTVQPPSVPLVQTPGLPTIQPPGTPTVQTPSVPVVQPPSTPTVQTPGLPVVQPPSTPTMQTPGLPVVQPPSTPTMQTPGLPVVQPPSTPTAQTPGLPVVQPPSTPTAQTPSTPAPSLAPSTPTPGVTGTVVFDPIVPHGGVVVVQEMSGPIVGRAPLFPRVNALFSRQSDSPQNGTCTVLTEGGTIVSGVVVSDPFTGVYANSVEVRKPWRPGDYLFGWWNRSNTPKTEFVKIDEPVKLAKPIDFLTNENKIAEKRINDKLATTPKAPFSTSLPASAVPATPPEVKKPEAAPLAMTGKEDKPAVLPEVRAEAKPSTTSTEQKDMWGQSKSITPPGKELVNPKLVKLPPAPTSRPADPLMSPERFNPSDEQLRPKAAMLAPVPKSPDGLGFPPLGTQSVFAARAGLEGPVAMVPYPVVTVPQPNHPPLPPPPAMPDAPQLNAYVNAFSPPPAPKGPAQQGPGAMPQWMQPNPAMQQQAMMQQQMMQQQMMQQQMMAQGYRPNPMNPYQPAPTPSTGPTANYSRGYQGPVPPANPFAPPAMAGGYPPAGNPPMMPPQAMMPGQPPLVQQVGYQQPTQQAPVTQQVEQLIRTMRESPYPTQRQWAAQSLASFEWRAHPQIVPAMLQSASQDPAAQVRADCVSCLGRMGAAIEPVFSTLQSMRKDIDPRVRQEVDQAFTRLGQTPTAPR